MPSCLGEALYSQHPFPSRGIVVFGFLSEKLPKYSSEGTFTVTFSGEITLLLVTSIYVNRERLN